jgi:hypothetical protein
MDEGHQEGGWNCVSGILYLWLRLYFLYDILGLFWLGMGWGLVKIPARNDIMLFYRPFACVSPRWERDVKLLVLCCSCIS